MGSASQESASTAAGVVPDAESGAASERDELFHVLRSRRRRFAIHHLKRASGPVDVGDLARQVAAWENEVPVEEVTAQQRRRVYNALQQTHLPELEDAGIVEVDRRDVELTDRVEALDLYLEVVPGGDFPWSQYYLALSAVSGALMLGAWTDVLVFAALPDVAFGMFCVTAFAVSSAAHVYDSRDMKLGDAGAPPEFGQE